MTAATRFEPIMASAAAIALLSACSGQSPQLIAVLAVGPSDATVCEQAAARYGQCMEELLGPQARALVDSKREGGVEQCANDAPTVSMYRQCLPSTDCDGFLSCLELQAASASATPTRPAGGDRAELCAAHADDGLRGVAMQVVVLTKGRTQAEARAAQSCVLGDAHWTSCVTASERAEVESYRGQRQRDCEAWDEPLAACILKLEGATGCDPNTYPFWRAPLSSYGAPSGPPVTATVTLTPHANGVHDPVIAFSGQTLVLADGESLRGWRDGAERWRLSGASWKLKPAGGWLAVVRDSNIHIIDSATGTPCGETIDDHSLVPTQAGVSVVPENGEEEGLAWLRQTRCKEGARRTPLVPTPSSWPRLVARAGDELLVADEGHFVLLDADGTQTLEVFGTVDGVSVLPNGRIAVADGVGVALLDPVGCKALGKRVFMPSTVFLNPELGTFNHRTSPPDNCSDCVIADRRCLVAVRHDLGLERPILAPVGRGAVAYNVHGFVAHTAFLGPQSTWSLKTGGAGTVAVDDDHIYVLSLGQGAEGPARVLAMAHADGATRWSTVLGPIDDDKGYHNGELGVWAADGVLAARVGTKVHIIKLPEKQR